ncbi:MAG: magnesium-translocating P-type ATPase, partial [Rhodospirillaceae bacterium]|nr:magnesium-translocating P-type ATPase [Rhodospirillaceae bacterium]
LRRSVALRARVLRDGAEREVPAGDLVPGDVVLLRAGDLVPADGVLLEARDLFVNQAILTGESFPAEKHAGAPASPTATPAEAANALFLGTSVLSGTARLLVCRTGRATMLGHVARELAHRPLPTAFEAGIRRYGIMILRLTVLLVLLVVLVNALSGRALIDSLLFALALAVGLTPELLPMVTTVTLARGALRLSRRRVIVKRLAALHDLGAMDVLCTDKTGTLTEARVEVARAIDADGRESARVLALAWLNSHFETGLRSPLDEAILACGGVDAAGWQKLDEVPFDFERRRVSVLVGRGDELLLLVKGAPEHVLDRASHCETAAGLRDVDEAMRERLRRSFASLSAEGFRAIAVAYRREPPGHRSAALSDEAELVFVGYVAFVDPPKACAADAIATLAARGVAVKILTGDNEEVTRHLCARLGLAVEGTLTGEQLSRLSDEALRARLDGTTLFCRLTPQQKTRVITALRRAGRTVGFLGDGINDAPALQAADIGISVDSAAAVAREAAALILLEHDLMPVHEAVEEGRRTFENVLKYVLMGTSSNFGNMFSMAGAALVLPFLPMRPAQILLNNLLYDLSETALPFDRVDAQAIARPERWDIGFVRRFMLVIGPVSSLFDFIAFFLLLRVFGAGEALFQSGWFVESLVTQALVVFVIRTRGPALASRPHPLLAGMVLLAVAVAVALPYSGAGAWFGLVPLPWPVLAAMAGLAAAYLGVVEVVKRLFWSRAARIGSGP